MREITVLQRWPEARPTPPTTAPMSTITAICFIGTRPMNISSRQVANSSSAVEALLRMIMPQINTHPQHYGQQRRLEILHVLLPPAEHAGQVRNQGQLG